MDIKKKKLKPGMNIKVFWVDGDEAEGIYVTEDRGYIILQSSGSLQACLPAHLNDIKVLKNGKI